jgi:site-specific recombinase XerD
MDKQSESLLDQIPIWQTDPMKAFEAFVVSPQFIVLGRRKGTPTQEEDIPAIREGSLKGYASMFGKFLRWMRAQNIDLFAITSGHIAAFLNERMSDRRNKSRDLNSAIRTRYLRLLERVYDHLQIHPNPAKNAAFDVFKSGDSGKDAPKVYLSDENQDAFMEALPSRMPPGSFDPGARKPEWKLLRDSAMLAMMLGAGLTVSEVTGLYVENIGEPDASGSVPVTVSPASVGGVRRKHTTLLRPFAVPDVMAWMEARKKIKFPGKLFFPSNMQGARVDQTTVYLIVKETFARAGITKRRPCGATLRNTFARRELLSGSTMEEVYEFMGHFDRKSTEKYDPARLF